MPHKTMTKENFVLAGYDDIFSISMGNADGEKIVHIPLTELFAPEFHPFNVVDDDAMHRLAKSVKEYGVREPGLCRPRADGGYELLCGNRRKRACELVELKTLPVIVREIDNDLATIVMVDSNLEQREKILPSEKAWAYKIIMDALNHNGKKGENHSFEIMVERTGISKNQLYRIIRLTDLIVTLLDKVDANQLAFNPAVELSYLTTKQQTTVAEAMQEYEIKPSLSQAVRLKKMKQADTLTSEAIYEILSETKESPISKTKITLQYRKYFPSEYSPNQMETVIIELLRSWQKMQISEKIS